MLETHSFLWFVAGDSRLSQKAQEVIADPTSNLVISVASIWEITIKKSLGKLDLRKPIEFLIERDIRAKGIEILAVGPAHFVVLESLPCHHRDPFDRMIIAQSIAEDIAIIGVDAAFAAYKVDLIS